MKKILTILMLQICLLSPFIVAQEYIPDPIAGDPEFEKGYAFYNKTEYDKAIPFFLKVLKQEPENLRAQVYLGVCHMGMENWSQAIDELNKALSMDHKYPLTNYALSVCHSRKQEPNVNEAKKYLKFAKEYGYHVPSWYEDFLERLELGKSSPTSITESTS